MTTETLPHPTPVRITAERPAQDAQEPGRTQASRPPVPFPLLDAAQRGPLWEGRSVLGRLVRLTAECNRYRGAVPFYTAAYGVRARGRAQAVRHTPSRHRAQALLTWFLRDVTDPEVLATAPRLEPARGRHSERPYYGGQRLPRFRALSDARGFGARL